MEGRLIYGSFRAQVGVRRPDIHQVDNARAAESHGAKALAAARGSRPLAGRVLSQRLNIKAVAKVSQRVSDASAKEDYAKCQQQNRSKYAYGREYNLFKGGAEEDP